PEPPTEGDTVNHQNLRPVNAGKIVDGLSNTIMMGEKHHADPTFPLRAPAQTSGFKTMSEVASWAWTGGLKGCAPLFGSSAAGINTFMDDYQAITTSPAQQQDLRYNAWGSGHPGVAQFAFCDGSVHSIAEGVADQALDALSTREPPRFGQQAEVTVSVSDL
ncbi:MAG: DUF1559 domain-containing protein, partial [Planctomycetota bacterium]